MKTFFGVCGPKVNNSNAPLPPPAPPTPPPLPPLLQCPVPFGSSGGQLEDGTDHTRAPGQAGSGLAGSEIVTALTCNPWCLFNLTDDIGERNDLGANPQYQEIAQKIAARLKYHGSTGPMPAYIYEDKQEFSSKINDMCVASVKSGC